MHPFWIEQKQTSTGETITWVSVFLNFFFLYILKLDQQFFKLPFFSSHRHHVPCTLPSSFPMLRAAERANKENLAVKYYLKHNLFPNIS